MLKLIPRENPEHRALPKVSQKQKKKHSRKRSNEKKGKIQKLIAIVRRDTKEDEKKRFHIIETTGKKLIHFVMCPNKHSEKDMAGIIHDLHRSILSLQRVRQNKIDKIQKKKKK